MQEKRAEWKEVTKDIPKEKLVFLDESGVNTNLVRRYGRSVGKTRVVDNAPFSTPQNTTVLSAIRQDGQFACKTFDGGTTKERFKEYLETVLLPSIHEGDYVIMDNLRTHHCNFVGELIRAKGATPLYLPPYSPDLNPIEKMWSKMKSILRKWRIRVKDRLIPAIHEALNSITPSDCLGWFACSGY